MRNKVSTIFNGHAGAWERKQTYGLVWTKFLATLYSNPSQTRGPKLMKFSNSRFLLLFFSFKLAPSGLSNSWSAPANQIY